ncbi:hypothetical protein D2F48_23535, partial [Salmonella enterica]|nr:hypothetical protein [Salmonella enterica]
KKILMSCNIGLKNKNFLKKSMPYDVLLWNTTETPLICKLLFYNEIQTVSGRYNSVGLSAGDHG